MDIDGLVSSFIQTGYLVGRIRKIVPDLVLVAKVANSSLRNCTDIVSQSDAIMIDRGDLAAEIGSRIYLITILRFLIKLRLMVNL